jgi:HK97 family phage major capsid protein
VSKWYLKGLTGYNFQYAPTPGGAAQDFHGFPSYLSDDMASYLTASGKPVLFGNFSYYGMIEKPGMIVQRNPYLFMGTGQVGIYASIFRGGAVLQSEAFYYLNSHA